MRSSTGMFFTQAGFDALLVLLFCDFVCAESRAQSNRVGKIAIVVFILSYNLLVGKKAGNYLWPPPKPNRNLTWLPEFHKELIWNF